MSQVLDNILDSLWLEYGSPEGMEKNAAVEYFYRLRKDDLDQEALGDGFCKLAEGFDMDPWYLANQVADHIDAFEVLTKTSQDPMVRELSEYYLTWADDLEKNAFLPALGRLAGTAVRGARGAQAAVGRGVAATAAGARRAAQATATGVGRAAGAARAAPAQARAAAGRAATQARQYGRTQVARTRTAYRQSASPNVKQQRRAAALREQRRRASAGATQARARGTPRNLPGAEMPRPAPRPTPTQAPAPPATTPEANMMRWSGSQGQAAQAAMTPEARMMHQALRPPTAGATEVAGMSAKPSFGSVAMGAGLVGLPVAGGLYYSTRGPQKPARGGY